MANRTESTPPAPITAPISTAETNQTNYSQTNSADEIDLNRVWEQVLDRVRRMELNRCFANMDS